MDIIVLSGHPLIQLPTLLRRLLPIFILLSITWTAWDPRYATFKRAQLQGREVRLRGKREYNVRLQTPKHAHPIYSIKPIDSADSCLAITLDDNFTVVFINVRLFLGHLSSRILATIFSTGIRLPCSMVLPFVVSIRVMRKQLPLHASF